ncbi:MAG: mercury(II) reductase [Parvularculaceae bacterium]
MPDSFSTDRNFDLAVIGAGSAGFSAAITAAEMGARVALVGHGTIGGTCVNVGCVPSKTMIRAMEAVYGARAAARFPGLTGEARVDDWAALIKAKDDLVADLRKKKYIDLLSEYENVTYISGAAQLSEGGVSVEGTRLRADKIIIATGARAGVPDIPGIDRVSYLTSTEALELLELPRSLIVIGGGFIGCELAQMFSRAGSNVSLIARSRLAPGAEPEISRALAGHLEDEGISVYTGLAYERAEQTDRGATLTISQDSRAKIISAEHMLVATGRIPNTEGLGLEEAGVELGARGEVLVDVRMRTTNDNIYAAGDVTGRDQFVYMAAYGAKLAAKNAVAGDAPAYDNSAMPWVVSTDPQIAGAGLSEAEAIEAGYDVKTSIAPLDQVPRALAARDMRGLIKLIADKESDRLLGAQILAPEGGDSIQTIVLALQFGMTAKQLGETIFPYLTTVEGIKLAAQGFDRDVAKLSCCAG